MGEARPLSRHNFLHHFSFVILALFFFSFPRRRKFICSLKTGNWGSKSPLPKGEAKDN